MYLWLAKILIPLFIFGGVVWKTHSWYVDSLELVNVKHDLQQTRDNLAELAKREETTRKAYDAATRQLGKLRRDAAGSQLALVGLSGAVEKTLTDSGTSLVACVERASTLGELFKSSAEEYRGLAEKADRHVVDIKALTALGFAASPSETEGR